MSLQEDDVQPAQAHLYWERHATMTCVVLTLAVLASSSIRPIGWPLFLSCFFAGVALYAGNRLADRRIEVAVALLLGGIGLAVYGLWVSGVGRGSLLWVQGGGILGAAFLASKVLHKAIRDESGNSLQ